MIGRTQEICGNAEGDSGKPSAYKMLDDYVNLAWILPECDGFMEMLPREWRLKYAKFPDHAAHLEFLFADVLI